MSIVRYQVTGMDCTSCAEKIEAATRGISGVAHVKVSIASRIMTLELDNQEKLSVVEGTVEDLGYQVDRLDVATTDEVADDDDKIPNLSHITTAYRRALWIVVLLNLGYGTVEVVGSFLAGSQALQADSLDFLGDGLISVLGLVAVGWGLAARAKAALLQGIFLGTLGFGVVGSTVYRVLVDYEPQTTLMAAFAAVAFAVNLLAAVVLMPHRKGDANMRAVWLFSRNDAIANLAVVLAAGLVWWSHTPWPDLVVAFVVAGLFISSAWSIVRDARTELHTTRNST